MRRSGLSYRIGNAAAAAAAAVAYPASAVAPYRTKGGLISALLVQNFQNFCKFAYVMWRGNTTNYFFYYASLLSILFPLLAK